MKLNFFFVLLAIPMVALGSTKIAITVDDLPVHDVLPQGVSRLQVAKDMLKVFKKHHLRGIYGFINAKKATDSDTSAVLKVWVSAGQKLGNHTFSHADLNIMPVDVYENNIKKNEATLSRTFSGDFHWFRYPYLQEGQTQESRDQIRKFLKKEGYKIAQVSYTFGDWNWQEPYARCEDKEDIQSVELLKSSYMAAAEESLNYNRALSKQLFGREIPFILLIHIGAFTTKMLDELLGMLERQDVRFISLAAAYEDPVYQMNPNLLSEYTGPFLDQFRRAKQLPPPFELKKKFPKEYAKLCQQPSKGK